MSNTTDSAPWTHNTYREIELARISIETLQAELEQAHAALAECHRTHEASLAVQDLCWEDAVEELVDHPDVGDYGLAEAILRNDRCGGPEVAGVDCSRLHPNVVCDLRDWCEGAGKATQTEWAERVAKAADPADELDAIKAEVHERLYG